jgi:enamine deaminase RidA (YjgF/YER057c/UK114 family)
MRRNQLGLSTFAVSQESGTQVAALNRSGLEELTFTATRSESRSLAGTIDQVAGLAQRKGASILSLEVLGWPRETPDTLRRVCAGQPWPVSWVARSADASEEPSGLILRAVAGAEITLIRQNGRAVGAFFDDGIARHCYLSGLVPALGSASREHQARNLLIGMEAALAEAHMQFSHVVRTWFYLRDILSWYDSFNAARTEFLSERGIPGHLAPASTGIGADNCDGTLVTAGAYAVYPSDCRVTVTQVPSPMQPPALRYGSAFSRAVSLGMPDHNRLLISGTASIGRDGTTICAGDMAAQTAHTMRVVSAVLASCGMGWHHVSRAVAYVKGAKYTAAVNRCLEGCGFGSAPLVVTEGDICRSDLLFEIELDAISTC